MSDLHYATSTDGTRIAYECSGSGAPILLIGGAFNDRSSMVALAALLAPTRTVVVYDRRGRGDSDPGPALGASSDLAAAEIADASAVLRAAAELTGHCHDWHLFGHSSGAVLALRVSTEGAASEMITRVTAYEPTWIIPGTRLVPPTDYTKHISRALARGDRDVATAAFLEQSALVPIAVIEQMKSTPAWLGLTALAHTLPHDLALHGEDWAPPQIGATANPDRRIDILVGANSPEWFHATAREVARVYTGCTITLDGQDHNVLWQPQALLTYLS